MVTPPTYLIDNGPIMNLSGADQANPTRYAAHRAAIWGALEQMIREGRLKTVPQVNRVDGELAFLDQASYDRLKPLRDLFTPPSDPSLDVEAEVQTLLAKYQMIEPNITYTRDPADPYLVVYAKHYGCTVVSDETSKTTKRGRRAKRDYLPDVCPQEGVRCITFDQFLTECGIEH